MTTVKHLHSTGVSPGHLRITGYALHTCTCVYASLSLDLPQPFIFWYDKFLSVLINYKGLINNELIFNGLVSKIAHNISLITQWNAFS